MKAKVLLKSVMVGSLALGISTWFKSDKDTKRR